MTRPWLLALVLLVATAAGVAPSHADDGAAIEAAEKALAEGRADEAHDAFRALQRAAAEATPPRPPDDRVLRGLARALLAREEPYAALEPLEALARGGAPKDLILYAESLLAHVRAVRAEGNTTGGAVAPFLEDARRALARVPADGPDATTATWWAGETEFTAGRLDKAVEHWERAAAAAGQDAPPWFQERRANALYQLGRRTDAALLYESLGRRQAAGSAWAAAREGEKALAHYAALLAETPGDAQLLDEAVSAARYTSTQAQLETVLAALAPPDAEARAAVATARARLARQQGQPARAVELLAAAREGVAPATLARLSFEHAGALLELPAGNEDAREEATRLLTEAWTAVPGDADLARWLSFLVQVDFRAAPRTWPDRRPLVRALQLQRLLTQSTPDDPLAQRNLGNVARLAGELDEAMTALGRAVELSGGDPSTRNDLGLTLLSAGRKTDAAAAFEQVLADDRGMLAAAQNLARELVVQGGAGDLTRARTLLLGAEAQARLAGSPSHVYRALALKAWRASRPTPASGSGR